MEQRLTLITLGVADLAVSRAFYSRLGWRESSSSNSDVAFYQIGSMGLALFGREALAEDAGVAADGQGFRGISLAINARSREETDKLYAEFLAAGAKAVKPPQDVFWGGYSGYVSDPDGYLLEIAYNPFWELTPDGGLRLPV